MKIKGISVFTYLVPAFSLLIIIYGVIDADFMMDNMDGPLFTVLPIFLALYTAVFMAISYFKYKSFAHHLYITLVLIFSTMSFPIIKSIYRNVKSIADDVTNANYTQMDIVNSTINSTADNKDCVAIFGRDSVYVVGSKVNISVGDPVLVSYGKRFNYLLDMDSVVFPIRYIGVLDSSSVTNGSFQIMNK